VRCSWPIWTFRRRRCGACRFSPSPRSGSPSRSKGAHPDIPWLSSARFRNRLVHAYLTIDLNLVWAMIDKDLPPLKAAVDRELASRRAGT